MTVSLSEITINKLEELKRQPSYQAIVKPHQEGKVAPRYVAYVASILAEATQPITFNEIYWVIDQRKDVKPSSPSIYYALTQLMNLGLVGRREQTDHERDILGIVNGRRGYLYWHSEDVPERFRGDSIPGIAVAPIPKKKKRKKSAQARKAKVQTGTSVAKVTATTTYVSGANAIERLESTITEMQDRISSLESELQSLHQILR